MPKVSRNCSFTSGMPFAISSSVGRITLIYSSGFAPGATFTPFTTESEWSFT